MDLPYSALRLSGKNLGRPLLPVRDVCRKTGLSDRAGARFKPVALTLPIRG